MKSELLGEIAAFVRQYRHDRRPVTSWLDPLLGAASASDPLFQTLKLAVSPSHVLPRDLLPAARSVVAFFLPFDRAITRSNRSGETASREWALAYMETNLLIAELGGHLQRILGRMGHAAAVTPPTHNFDPERLVSDWSHRHVAFIAGLGQFGLNRMLITSVGCCGRLGSLVTSAEIAPDPVLPGQACLYRHDGSCARCAARCVNGALTRDGFDRHRCYAMCLRNASLHQDLGLADVCGKCLTGVPCAWQNPVAARLDHEAHGSLGAAKP